MQINFYPESDNPKFEKAAKVYSDIWKKNGKKFISAIEKVSKLKFKTKLINAVTYEGFSYSLPLKLRSSYTEYFKIATLIHELCHRLLIDHKFYIFDTKNLYEDIYKIVNLILFDIWCNLFDEKMANEFKNKEISYGDKSYINAWSWALAFSKEEREEKFKEMTLKYSNYKKPKKKI